MSTPSTGSEPRLLIPSLLFIALVVAAVDQPVDPTPQPCCGPGGQCGAPALHLDSLRTPQRLAACRCPAVRHRAVAVLGAFAFFAIARSNLTELLVSMAILGFGVGSFSAAMPAVILAVTRKSETSSAMSFNQVVRSVGFSLGSAVGGLVLAAGTDTGHLFPTDGAYTTAALIGIAAMAVAAMTSIAPAALPLPGAGAIHAREICRFVGCLHSSAFVLTTAQRFSRSNRRIGPTSLSRFRTVATTTLRTSTRDRAICLLSRQPGYVTFMCWWTAAVTCWAGSTYST